MGSGNDARWDPVRTIQATCLEGAVVPVAVELFHRPRLDATVALRITDAGCLVLLPDQLLVELSIGLQAAVLVAMQRPW